MQCEDEVPVVELDMEDVVEEAPDAGDTAICV